MEPGVYCREVESYLCRRNDGHLIRIVGPAFDLVCGWAEREIPIRVVFGAIDRTFQRYYSKGPRRRPVRIEFCEADVLDLFDEWRRAVGVAGTEGTRATSERRPSLATHVERVMEHLRFWLETADLTPSLSEEATRAIDALVTIHGEAGTARGEARQTLIAQLAELERQLVEALRASVTSELRDRLRAETVQELEPFRQRMPPLAFEQALAAGFDRLLSDHYKLPRIAFH